MEKVKIKKLFIGTKNRDKLAEIVEIIKGYEIMSLNDIPDVPEVIEDKDTIEGNAIKKAVEVAQYTKMPTVADDTGLFVRALNNRPGVYSARYAGDDCSYEDNRNKMLQEMHNKEDRYAEFRTVVALADESGLIATAFGIVPGEITKECKGQSGFGYDPIFKVKETGLTYSEMTEEDKNKISHRAKAFNALKNELNKYYKELQGDNKDA
jgi:XTP/dITP diphosphohydrolase